MARREEKKYDFLGLFTEEIGGKSDKSNGAINLIDNKLFIEKRSRLNGKIKESYEISFDDLDSEKITRPAINRIEIQLKDKKLKLKTFDHEMLDNFEDKLLNIVEGPKMVETPQTMENTSKVAAVQNDSKISEIDIPDQIRKYHELFKEGIISEEEFENKKKELLNG